MRRLAKTSLTFAAIAVIVTFAAQATQATPVTFSTTGTFSGGGGSSLVLGTNTLTFSGSNDTADPMGGFTFVPLGTFAFANNNNPGGSVPAGTTFTLTITQISPAGVGNVIATVTGNVMMNNSTIVIDFGNTVAGPFPNSVTLPASGPLTFTYSPITVAIANPPLTTTLQGRLVETAIPEPATILLLGTGLAGAAGLFRRRFKSHD